MKNISNYQQTTLDNGLIVATDYMDSVESISIGAFVAAGSNYEDISNNGVAHFLEHMAFKGTERRTAEDIAREIDDVGGHMNAYTSRETTAYHLKLLKEDLGLGVDMLGDILNNSLYDTKEINKEKGVIIQEIGQYADSPEDVVFDNLQAKLYPDQPMGRSILGTNDTVNNMSREQLTDFIKQNYSAKNMLLVGAGNINHQEFVEMANQHFSKLSQHEVAKTQAPKYIGGEIKEKRDLEQVQLALCWEGVNNTHPDYYAASIWATILGGSSSSRLFREIREKRGLCYHVGSFVSASQQSGTFDVCAGTAKKDVEQLLELTHVEIAKACKEVSPDELKRAKAQFSAGIRMSMESTSARMSRVARNLTIHGKQVPLDDLLAKIEAVTIEQACAIGTKMYNGSQQSLSMVGDIE